MNANDAAEIIIAAIGEDRPLDAADLATALSHLGLLTYTTDPRLTPRLSPPARATSSTQERPSPEESPRTEAEVRAKWATLRTRD